MGMTEIISELHDTVDGGSANGCCCGKCGGIFAACLLRFEPSSPRVSQSALTTFTLHRATVLLEGMGRSRRMTDQELEQYDDADDIAPLLKHLRLP